MIDASYNLPQIQPNDCVIRCFEGGEGRSTPEEERSDHREAEGEIVVIAVHIMLTAHTNAVRCGSFLSLVCD